MCIRREDVLRFKRKKSQVNGNVLLDSLMPDVADISDSLHNTDELYANYMLIAMSNKPFPGEGD